MLRAEQLAVGQAGCTDSSLRKARVHEDPQRVNETEEMLVEVARLKRFWIHARHCVDGETGVADRQLA